MEFFTTDLDGVTLIEPDEETRRGILESVASSMEEYPEVYLTHEDGIVLSYRSGGILIREEDGEVCGSLADVPLKTAIQAWNFLVAKKLEALNSLPWREE